MDNDDDVMLDKFHWNTFLRWREERDYELCVWHNTLSGIDIMQNDKFIAYKTNIPERYYVLKEYIVGTPWERFVSVTTVTN